MRMRNGWSLVEVLVATCLVGFLALLTGDALLRAGGALRSQSERYGREHALRASQAALRTLLQDGEAAGADLGVAGGAGLLIRVARGRSVLCGVTDRALLARRDTTWWSAVREPVAGRDSLEVATPGRSGWSALALIAPPERGRCPDGSLAAALPVVLDSAARQDIGPGTPVRFFEPVELRSYLSGGSHWLGLRLVATGEAIQPLAGPLLPAGLVLEYRDRTGQSTTDSRAVSSVRFRLGALGAAGRSDSLSGVVALRDSP